MPFGTAFFLRSVTLAIVVDMRFVHNGDAAVCDETYPHKGYNINCKSKETKMLKRFFNAMIVARQASAAAKTLPYLTDSHLEEMGFGRDTFVEGIKAIVEAELDASDAEKAQAIPVNPNLVGAV